MPPEYVARGVYLEIRGKGEYRSQLVALALAEKKKALNIRLQERVDESYERGCQTSGE